MMAGPLRRIIARDERVLALVDMNVAPKDIAVQLELSSYWLVYDAVKRRKKFPDRYCSTANKFPKDSQTFPNSKSR